MVHVPNEQRSKLLKDTTIGVGKQFFTETAAKAMRDSEVTHVLKTATEFGQWLPNAIRTRIEQGRHHPFNFSVYQVEYKGQIIEFKCKMTEFSDLNLCPINNRQGIVIDGEDSKVICKD